MPSETRPVLSVIVRRFDQDFEQDVQRSLEAIQQAVAAQPGFSGLQNSLSRDPDGCELVTVFAFDSRENLENWENSPLRRKFVAELDNCSRENLRHTQFGDLALLLHPGAKLSKIETVAILIFWILLLGAALNLLAGLLLPQTLHPFWQNALLVTVNVLLISYIFLPWSGRMLTRLKTRLSGKPPKT